MLGSVEKRTPHESTPALSLPEPRPVLLAPPALRRAQPGQCIGHGCGSCASAPQSQSEIQPVGIGTANGVDQNYAAASPNDPDLGEQAILKRVEKYQPFTVEVGTPFYYTSNVALVDRGRVGDVIIAPVAGITYAPRFGKTFYGGFSIRQQFFYYTDNSGFDFASFDVLAGLVYYLPALHNLTLRANIDYNRLTGTDDFNDFFSNYATRAASTPR